MSFPVKIISSGALLALPIFFTSVVFAIVIKQEKDTGAALGSNLLGAVIGGFFEYTSMVWGLKILYLVASGWYIAAAFYLYLRKRNFA